MILKINPNGMRFDSGWLEVGIDAKLIVLVFAFVVALRVRKAVINRKKLKVVSSQIATSSDNPLDDWSL